MIVPLLHGARTFTPFAAALSGKMPKNESSGRVQEVYIHEDDWGLVSFLPEENLDHAQSVFQQAAEHHKDAALSEDGCTTPPFFIPYPKVQDGHVRLTDHASPRAVHDLTRSEGGGVRSARGASG